MKSRFSLPTDPAEATQAQNNTTPPADTPIELETVTLKDLGPNLPIGFLAGDTRVRPFRLRPFRLKEEKELAKAKDNAKAMTFGRFVSMILAKMVQTIGPHSFDSMNDGERMLVVNQMYMADVLYTYLYLRYEAMGADEPVPIKVHCPRCKNQFMFDADLGSLEIRKVPDGVTDLRRVYRLRDGFPIQGQTRQVLYMHPLKWSIFEQSDFTTADDGEKAAKTLAGSIVGAEGVTMNPLAIFENEIDELTKYDMEGMVRDIEDNSPGPQMVVQPTCDVCKHEIKTMLDWTYQSFFSRPSLHRRGTA